MGGETFLGARHRPHPRNGMRAVHEPRFSVAETPGPDRGPDAAVFPDLHPGVKVFTVSPGGSPSVPKGGTGDTQIVVEFFIHESPNGSGSVFGVRELVFGLVECGWPGRSRVASPVRVQAR